MVKIVVTGGVSYNLMVYLKELPEPRSATVFSQAYHETVGGTGAGKALALHRLGCQVTLNALLGNDVQGQAVRDYFAHENLECLFEHDPRGTERHLNLMAGVIACGKKLVVCTHGSAGATALTPQGEWHEIPALAGYSVTDTNGAGDSFFAGVLYGHAYGCTLLTCLQLGALLGALSVTSRELVPRSLSLMPARI